MIRSKYKKTLYASFLVVLLVLSQFSVYADTTQVPPAENSSALTVENSQTDNSGSGKTDSTKTVVSTEKSNNVSNNVTGEEKTPSDDTSNENVQKPQAVASADERSITEWTKHLSITEKDYTLNGTPISELSSPITIYKEGKLNFTLTWLIDPELVNEENPVKPGDTAVFPLPKGFAIAPGTSLGKLEDNLGYYDYDATTHSVVLKFTDGVLTKPLSRYSGNLSVQTIFSKVDTIVNEEIEIKNPFSDEVFFTLKPGSTHNNQSITKDGAQVTGEQAKDGDIVWKIKVNEDYQTLKNAVVSDLLPEGLEVTKVEVYDYDLTLDNAVVNRELQTNPSYTTSPKVEVNLGDINSPKEIIITTKATKLPLIAKEVPFKNVATLTSDDTPSKEATKTVNYKLDDIIKKSGVSYNSDDRTFSWALAVNPSGITLKKGTTITDTLGDTSPLVYEKDSFVFNIDGIDYTIAQLESTFSDVYKITVDNDTNNFVIEYLSDSSHKLNLKYKTSLPESAITDFKGSPTNTVTIDGGEDGKTSDTATGPGYSRGDVTKGASINYKDKTITWTILLNEGKHSLKTINLIDTITKGSNGLTFVPNSFVLKNNMTSVETNISSIVEATNAPNKAFSFDYAVKSGEERHSYTLTYVTNYDPELRLSEYENKADVNFVTTNNTIKGDSTKNVKISDIEQANGAKKGSYNPNTQEFTWTVYLNYNGLDINAYEFEDVLTANQKFIAGSVRIFAYEITDAAGNYAEKSGVQLPQPVTTIDGQKLTVKLDDVVEKRIGIEFKTSMKDNFIPNEVVNNAITKYWVDGVPATKTIDVSATVNLTPHNGGEIIGKSGSERTVEGTKYFDWVLDVNKSNSNLTKYSLEDILTNSHSFEKETLKVYSATKSNGALVIKTLLEEGKDYTLSYGEKAIANEPSAETMTIDFKTIKEDRMFIVKYSTVAVYEQGKVTYGNDVVVDAESTSKQDNQYTASQSFVVTTGDSSVVAKGNSYTIRKVDENGDPLQGVEFELSYVSNGRVVKSVVTDANGIAKFEDIFASKYKLREVTPLPGFGISNEYYDGKQITVNSETTNAADPFQVVNKLNTISVRKSSSTLDAPDLTTEFQVLDKDTNEVLGTFTTDETGFGTFDNNGKGLTEGEYIVVETKAPVGHTLDTSPQTVTITGTRLFNEDGSQTLEFLNHKGSVTLTKVDENNQKIMLPITFDLYKDGEKLSTHTTENGVISLINTLAPGSYAFIEQAPTQDYLPSRENIEFTIDSVVTGVPEVIELTAVNYKSLIEFKKVNAAGDALQGAKFGIYTLEADSSYDTLTSPIQEATSDNDGWVRFEGLIEGDYVIKELSAPAGYLLNKTLVPVSVVTPETNTKVSLNPLVEGFVNVVGGVVLTKYDGSVNVPTNSTLEGVTFNLYKDTDTLVATGLVTDSKGQIGVSDLEPGNYYFVETQTVEGFFMNPTHVPFTINDNGDARYLETVSLTNYKANVSFTKTDGNKGLSGAEFTLEKDGVVVSEAITSDENGRVVFEDLGPGDYTYYETKAPQGYVRNTQTYIFTLDASEQISETLNITATDVINYKGSVTLSKVDVAENPLENAVYRIMNDAYEQIGDTYTTDEMGRIEITNTLAPGHYYFEEVSAPEGFIRSTQVVPFIISDSAEDVPEIVNVTHTNYQGSVQFNKVDVDRNPLQGAHFALYNATNDVVQETVSTEDGLVRFENVAPGSYTIKEIQATSGYILNTQVIEFEMVNEAVSAVEMTLENFINYQGSFVVNKVDRNGNLLKEARFELYNENGELVKELVTVDGIVRVEGLAPGKYILKEVEAPVEYLLSKDIVEITIASESLGEPEAQMINFLNEIKPIVKGVSKDPKGPQTILPATGVDNKTILLGTALFAIGIAIIALAKINKSNKKQEEK